MFPLALLPLALLPSWHHGLDCFINSVLAYVHVLHIYCLKISLNWYFVNWGSKRSKCFIHYLNIQPPIRKWLQIFETLHLASLQIITFDHFWIIHLIFLDRCLKFLIFQYWEWAFSFLSTIHFNTKSLSLFLNQILVYVTTFAAHYLFSFWDLHLLSSLRKTLKIKWEEI